MKMGGEPPRMGNPPDDYGNYLIKPEKNLLFQVGIVLILDKFYIFFH